MKKSQNCPADLVGIPYRDSKLSPVEIYEDTSQPQPRSRYFIKNTPELTILARLLYTGDNDDQLISRDGYDLKFYVPYKNPSSNRTELVDFLALGDILAIRVDDHFLSQNPLISIRIQGPRRIPLLVTPKMGSADHGILDPVCEDEKYLRENFGKLVQGRENALFNLHAQFMPTRTRIVNWQSSPVDGSCETTVSSELNEEYALHSSCVRSPNNIIDQSLLRIYSRSFSATNSLGYNSASNSQSAGFSGTAAVRGDKGPPPPGPIIIPQPPGF